MMSDASATKAKKVKTMPVPLLALDLDEAAAALGMSPSSFQRHVRPEIARIHIGERIVLYRIADLVAWLDRKAELPIL